MNPTASITRPIRKLGLLSVLGLVLLGTMLALAFIGLYSWYMSTQVFAAEREDEAAFEELLERIHVTNHVGAVEFKGGAFGVVISVTIKNAEELTDAQYIKVFEYQISTQIDTWRLKNKRPCECETISFVTDRPVVRGEDAGFAQAPGGVILHCLPTPDKKPVQETKPVSSARGPLFLYCK